MKYDTILKGWFFYACNSGFASKIDYLCLNKTK